MTSKEGKQRVLVTRHIPYLQEKLAQDSSIEVDMCEPSSTTMPREEMLSRIAGCTGLVCTAGDKVDVALLDSAGKSLRVVSTISAGFDHMDLALCRERGIHVGNTPGCLQETTAELAVALTFAAKRRLFESHRGALAGEWGASKFLQFCGSDVSRNTVGIIGLGEIGLSYARFMKNGFQCRILYTGPREKPNDIGAEFVDLPTLLRLSDIVSILAPLNAATTKLLNSACFAQMQKHAVLVNTARGGIVDQDALIHALSTSQIAAAGLDVTDPEPLPVDHILQSLPNCIVLPHIGSATVKTRHKMVDRALENLVAGLDGQSLPYPVA
ncbi:hypothetical protein AeNC1_004752 [Aphanomyces euteiches]|nr:hypothetical protein AeNC1_004752 [Aphanomyces euteiches]